MGTVLASMFAALLLLAASAGAQLPRPHEPEQSRPWAAYFSPNGGAAKAVVEALGRATQLVRVQASILSSPEIAKALLDAHHRGVKVEVILDRRQAGARYSSAATLARAGITTLVDGKHAAANDNVMVIDRQTVITGSFGFTPAADTQNAENLLVINAPALAVRYGDNWQGHAAHSAPFVAR